MAAPPSALPDTLIHPDLADQFLNLAVLIVLTLAPIRT